MIFFFHYRYVKKKKKYNVHSVAGGVAAKITWADLTA